MACLGSPGVSTWGAKRGHSPASHPKLSRAQPTPRSAWIAALAVALGLIAFIGVLLARTGGPIRADATEHVKLSTVFGPLSPSTSLRQSFIARADGLSSVEMRFGTFGGVTRCTVEVRITSNDSEVAARQIPCASLVPDSALVQVASFPPQQDSNGRTYEVEVSIERAGEESVSVWGGTDIGGSLPPVQLGSNSFPAAAEIHTGYGGGHHAWDQVGTALRRMEQYRPRFQRAAVVVSFAIVSVAALIALVALRGRRALALLIVLVAAKGALWAAVVPPLEAPDEPAHVGYAQFMAEAHRIPKRNVSQLGLPPQQFYSPQLTGLVNALHQESQPPGDRPDFQPNGDGGPVIEAASLSPESNGNGAAAGYPPAYYVGPAILYKLSPGSLIARIEVMRWWSIALGAVAAWLTLLIGRRLFPGSEGAAIALAVACALQPELSQQTATVNNDALVIAGGAACFLAALELLRPSQQRTRWLCALAGAALGVTMFKSFGVVFAPVLLAAWVIGRARTPQQDRIPIGREVALTALGVGATYGLWFVYAAVFGFQGASLTDLTPSPGPKGFGDYLRILREDWFRPLRRNWVDQLWGNFSWVDTPFPTWVQNVLLVLTLAVIAVMVVWAVATARRYAATRRGDGPSTLDDTFVEGSAQTLVLALSVFTMFVFCIVVGYLNFHQNGRNDLILGRYSLMLVPALLSAPVVAVRSLRPRLDPLVPMVLAAIAMVALNIGGLALLTERFYL